MTNRSKVYIPPVTSVKAKDASFNFVFSDDIAKWMPRVKPERKDRRRKDRGGRIDKNSWG